MVSEAGDRLTASGKWQRLIPRTEWVDWKQCFRCFCVATKLDKEDDEVQVSSLIYAMGPEAENIVKAFTFAHDMLC